MAIPRKKVLERIAGLRRPIRGHLYKHIPELIKTANEGLVEYWRKEVSRFIADFTFWAGHLSKHADLLEEAAGYQRELEQILENRLNELRG